MADTAPPTRRWFQFRLLTMFVAVAVAAVVLSFFLTPPGVSTRLARSSDGTLQLEVQQNFKVNYIGAIDLIDDSGLSIWNWKRDLNEKPPSRVAIRLHDQGSADRGKIQRSLNPGEEFSFRVKFQYDQGFAPCGGTQTFRFRLAADGAPEYLGKS
jgi:hypothetical protein